MVYLNRFRSIATLLVLNGRRIDSFALANKKGSRCSCAAIFSTSEVTTTSYWNDAEKETVKVEQLYYSSSDTRTPTVWTSREEVSAFVAENIDTVLFDCDGVLYRTKEACPGAKEALLRLESMGKKILFVTNNAGVNRQGLQEKISMVLDIPSLTEDQMVSSSYSSAKYLSEQLKPRSRIFVIGSAQLRAEVESAGFTITNTLDTNSSSIVASMDREELETYEFSEGPIDAIVVGHDTKFTFRKLSIANNLLLRNPDALLVATNHDPFDIGTSST